MNDPSSPIVDEPPANPVEIAKALEQRESFRRNLNWFEPRAAQIYDANRGKCICIAGEEVFVADSMQDSLRQARDAHPDDQGYLLLSVPMEKAIRIYASRRRVGSLR